MHRSKWWGQARAANGPGACGLLSVTTAAILFHETTTRIAEQHIARLITHCAHHHRCFECAFSALLTSLYDVVAFTVAARHRPRASWCSHFRGPQMQVQQGSALRNIDYYIILKHLAADASWCGPPRSLFWPHRVVVSALRAARLLTREPPPYLSTTPFWSADGYS